jgi:ATP-dependent Lhr-like helicase
VRYVILDEIHGVLGNKRGSFLSCQIDRLAMTAGEFQRVGLSATVRPAEAAAAFLGGLRRGANGWEGRPVTIAAPAIEKTIDFCIDFPGGSAGRPEDVTLPDTPSPAEGTPGQNKPNRYGERYTILIDIILERIKTYRDKGGGRPILVFTDSRRRAERITYLINQKGGPGTAYTHHGSLSKEVRRAVEQRLIEGSVPCVVATASLELGIDIGGVEEVILAGTPAGSAAALQRIIPAFCTQGHTDSKHRTKDPVSRC